PLQRVELGPGLDAEFTDEPASCCPISLEGLGLAPGAVEGDEELSLEAFAQRVHRHERLELGQDLLVAAEGEVGLDPVLDGAQSQMLYPPPLILPEQLVHHIPHH